MGIFHAYDIRGVYGETLLVDDVYKIGFFLPRLLQADAVLVGRDARASSPQLFEALADGIQDAGARVDDIGLATTPMVYFATATRGYRASVCLTASHNPARYNGLKISTVDSRPVGRDAGLGTLERWLHTERVTPSEVRGARRSLSLGSDYVNFLRGFGADLGGLRVAVDTGNGMAGLFARELLPSDSKFLSEAIDPTFPDRGPDPMAPGALDALRAAVLEGGLDAGVAFDGDGDRAVFIDERGVTVPPDLVLAILARFYLRRGREGFELVQDIRTSRSVAEDLEPRGVKVHTWKVGRAYGASRLRELDALIGGELAGHYYLKDFFYSDSALLATLMVLDVVAAERRAGGSLSSLVAGISRYHGSGEINFEVRDARRLIDLVRAQAQEFGRVRNISDIDGIRVDYDDWWFSLRRSNTEPLLRLVLEARRPEDTFGYTEVLRRRVEALDLE